MSPRVFILEDTPAWQQAFAALLSQSGRYTVSCVTSDYAGVVQAFEALNTNCQKPDLMILDYCIPETEKFGPKTGVDVGYYLMELGVRPEQMIIVSSSPPSEIGIPPYGNVPFAYLPKHRAASELIQRLDEMCLMSGAPIGATAPD